MVIQMNRDLQRILTMVRFRCYVGNLQLHCANVNHSILILIETLTHLNFCLCDGAV